MITRITAITASLSLLFTIATTTVATAGPNSGAPAEIAYVDQQSKTDFVITLLPKGTSVTFQCKNSNVSGDTWHDSNDGSVKFPIKGIRENDPFEVIFTPPTIPPTTVTFLPGYDVTLTVGKGSTPASAEESPVKRNTKPARVSDPSAPEEFRLNAGPPSITYAGPGSGGTGYLQCIFKAGSPGSPTNGPGTHTTYWNWKIHGTSAWCPPPPSIPAPKVGDAKLAQAASGTGIDYDVTFIPTVSGDTAPTFFTARVYANYITILTIEYK